jgi:ferric-dicitrate binding protein FerR (iron transport regulator)
MRGCKRWIALSDRAALGESLAAAERDFLCSHARECSECGAEQELWRSLETMETAAAAAPSTTPVRRANRLRFSVEVVLAAAAVAAAVLIVPRVRVRPPAPVAAMATPRPATCIGFVSGDVDVDGQSPSVGTALVRGSVLSSRAGAACLVLDGGVRACLSPHTRVRLAEIGGPDRRLEVLAGKVVAELEPQAPGSTFTLAARDGTATAIGTAFSVDVPEGEGPSITRVLHGRVLVRPLGAPAKQVSAHAQAPMTAAQPTPLAADDEEHDLSLLVRAIGSVTDKPAIASVESDPPGATVRIDDRIAGRTPLSILLDPGDHALVVENDGASSRDSLRLGAGERLDRRFDLRRVVAEPPLATASSAPRVDPHAPATVGTPGNDALSLLRMARDEGARGNVRQSAAVYQTLLARFPASPEAIASECAYAELQLGSLGDATGALRTFEHYLAHGGPLAEDAAYGRIRALRALGRRDEERSATETFLKEHSDGAAAAALRLRQEQGEGPR